MPWEKGQSGCPEKMWKKGQSGNLKGRPNKPPLINPEIEKALREMDPSGRMVLEAIAERLVQMARDGDLSAIKVLLERVDGPPSQRVEVTGETPILFTVKMFDGRTEDQAENTSLDTSGSGGVG